MTEIVKAFLKWKNTPMQDCCYDLGSRRSHWGRKRINIERELSDGRKLEGHTSEDFLLTDIYVCPRERAWRDYCSIRDGQNYHVEPLFTEFVK